MLRLIKGLGRVTGEALGLLIRDALLPGLFGGTNDARGASSSEDPFSEPDSDVSLPIFLDFRTCSFESVIFRECICSLG